MIPIINTLRNITLLAPVNLAFAVNKNPHDFENENLLSRYVVNQVFRVGYLNKNEVIFNTLFKNGTHKYPISIRPDFNSREYIIDNEAAIIESDIYAKHQRSYIQAIDHLLPQKPSMCEVLLNDSFGNDDDSDSFLIIQKLFILLFDPTLTEKIRSKKKKKKNALLPVSCDKLLENVNTLIIPSNNLLRSSLSDTHLRYYLTLYHSIQNANFSTSKEAIRDIRLDILALVKNFMITKQVGGVNGTNNANYTSIGDKVTFNLNLNHLTHELVLNNNFTALKSTTLADGILHIFNPIEEETNFITTLKIPVIKLTTKKVLYALHYSNFVRELKFRKLIHLIDGTTANQTLFIDESQKDDTQDEAVSSMRLLYDNDEDVLLTDKEDVDDSVMIEGINTKSFSAKQSLLYQFIDEYLNINEVVHQQPRYDRLFDTRLCSKSKIGSCFRLKVSASLDTEEDRTIATINDDISIISEPIEAENTNMIYILDKEIDTPSSFKHSLGALISNGVIQRHLEHIAIDKKSCLATLSYLNDFDLLLLDDNGKGYTVFLPCGDTVFEDTSIASKKGPQGTWDSLGLILKYLESHPKIFKEILRGFFIEDTIYSDFGLFDDVNTTMVSKSLRGDQINVSESYFDGGFNHFISLNQTVLSIPLNSDIFFNQGVVHIINKVLLPDDFHMSFYDLIKTTEDESYSHFSFLDLIESYPKLKHVLGLDNSKKDKTSKYSLLIPTAESLRDFNITRNFEELFNFLEFHLVPNTSLQPLIDCISEPWHGSHHNKSLGPYIIKTNYSDTELQCYHDDSNGKNFLQLYNSDNTAEIAGYNKDAQVRLLSHGCTSLHQTHEIDLDSLSCVFLIDKPLNLNWLKNDDDDNFLHIHLGFISIGVGIILGLILFGAVMLGVVLCLGQSKSTDVNNFAGSGLNDPSDAIFGRVGPSYMRVTGDDNGAPNILDRGYETDDDDLLRNEREFLLPMHGKKKRGVPRYGTTLGHPRVLGAREPTNVSAQNNQTSAPRSIRNNVMSNLHRDRNLPNGF